MAKIITTTGTTSVLQDKTTNQPFNDFRGLRGNEAIASVVGTEWRPLFISGSNPTIVMMVDENALMRKQRSPFNEQASKMAGQAIHGDVLVINTNEGDLWGNLPATKKTKKKK